MAIMIAASHRAFTLLFIAFFLLKIGGKCLRAENFMPCAVVGGTRLFLLCFWHSKKSYARKARAYDQCQKRLANRIPTPALPGSGSRDLDGNTSHLSRHAPAPLGLCPQYSRPRPRCQGAISTGTDRGVQVGPQQPQRGLHALAVATLIAVGGVDPGAEDRKSTRLNSSHVSISYAVFC